MDELTFHQHKVWAWVFGENRKLPLKCFRCLSSEVHRSCGWMCMSSWASESLGTQMEHRSWKPRLKLGLMECEFHSHKVQIRLGHDNCACLKKLASSTTSSLAVAKEEQIPCQLLATIQVSPMVSVMKLFHENILAVDLAVAAWHWVWLSYGFTSFKSKGFCLAQREEKGEGFLLALGAF